jgi:predicted house-cleaning noncanonical NTP pyrophosphatase (MazG superfamily)
VISTTAEKLVRDRTAEIIASSGETAIVRTANALEMTELLRQKLQDKVREYLDGSSLDKLVDVLEIVYALGRDNGCKPPELERRRLVKAAERGGFEQRLVLVERRSFASAAHEPEGRELAS